MKTPCDLFPPAIAVMLALAAVAGCGGREAQPGASAPTEVAVVVVEPADVGLAMEFVGKTESSRRVEIRSRVEGFLERIHYVEGSMVEDGQLLFQMDRKPFEAELRAARAELAQQRARLTTTTANLKRVRPLAQQNAVAQKELDDALGGYRTAAAAVEAAIAKVEQAELNLGYTEIRSPVTGVSSYAVKREGAYIGIGDSLLTYVARIEPMWVEFSVSENQIFRKREERKADRLQPPADDRYEVEIIMADGSVHPHRGRITFTDASISEATGTFLLRAEIANPERELRPGQFVRVRLLGARRTNAILVPQKAVQQGARGSFVWVIDEDGAVRFQPVQTGEWRGSDWFIDQGLSGGETVIVEGALKVRPGMTVLTVPYSGPEPSAAAQ